MLWVLLGVIVLVVAVRLLVEAVSAGAGFALFLLRRRFAYAVPGTPADGPTQGNRPGTAQNTSVLDVQDESAGSDEHPPFPDDR